MATGKGATGFLLGKFLPPHRGHQYLIDFARAYVDRLTVLVCSIAREPIPGELRHQWMREAFPGAQVIHHVDELPQAPEEHPLFWDLWRASIRRHVPGAIDYVFASESYGARLADELGARFVPVDLERRNVPVSGRVIRADPLAHWDDLLAPVRPYYLKRVCVIDPAQPSFASDLAATLGTSCMNAYGGGLHQLLQAGSDPDEILRLFHGQVAGEEALARQANRVLICELDALTIGLAAAGLQGGCPPDILSAAAKRTFDLYLLHPHAAPREAAVGAFLERVLAAGAKRRLRVATLHGSAAARLSQARAAIAATVGAEDFFTNPASVRAALP